VGTVAANPPCHAVNKDELVAFQHLISVKRWQPSLGSPAQRRRHERLERVKGIEPSSSAWKAVALPLSYTRTGATENQSSENAN
jgi:hypothetical protein